MGFHIFESQILALFDSYFRPLESHGFCSTCHRIGPLTPTTFLLNFLILLVFIFSDFDALFSQEFLGPMVKAGLNDHSLAIFIFIFYHNDTLTKLNKNVLGVKGPILTEVKQTQWDFNKSDQKKKSELSWSYSIDMMKYQETGWHPDVGPPRGRNW